MAEQGRIHGNPCRGRLGRGSNELGRGSNELGGGSNELGRGRNVLGRGFKGRSHSKSKVLPTDGPTDGPTDRDSGL